jgi:hypothetical protein
MSTSLRVGMRAELGVGRNVVDVDMRFVEHGFVLSQAREVFLEDPPSVAQPDLISVYAHPQRSHNNLDSL